MTTLRAASVARVVFSGTIGNGGATPLEIWSTGLWVGEFSSTVGGTHEMGGFDPVAYLDKAAAFGSAIMANSLSLFTLTLIKCNVFSVQTYTYKGASKTGLKQTTSPTVERIVNVAGGANDTAPYQASFGWGLQTTEASKGVASHGRMFLPAQGAPGSSGVDPFDNNGEWSGGIRTAVSAGLSPAWDALTLAGAGGVSYQPALVSEQSAGGGAFGATVAMNVANRTLAEGKVWTMDTRKNKIKAHPLETAHAAFLKG